MLFVFKLIIICSYNNIELFETCVPSSFPVLKSIETFLFALFNVLRFKSPLRFLYSCANKISGRPVSGRGACG